MSTFLYIRTSLQSQIRTAVPRRVIHVPSRALPTHVTSQVAAAHTQAQAHVSQAQQTQAQPHSIPHPHPHTTPPHAVPSPAYVPSPLVEDAVRQAAEWSTLPQQNAMVSRLANDPPAVAFVMHFTDRVMRAETPSVAASFLTRLVASSQVPAFMSAIDRALVQVGATVAPYLPTVVVSSARHRMRSIVAPFVGTVEKIDFKEGMSKNVNLLGEAVLGDNEALRRREEAEELLTKEGVDYVSVKVSGVTSQLNKWDFEGSMDRVLSSLRPLFQRAAESNPKVLINLDMEEYHDLEITIEAFTRLLSEPEFQDMDAGIVLQAYLPDSLPALQHLAAWSNTRPGKGEIKVRLVKGANLAMEKVDAAIHGWEQAPYTCKSDTDANYLRCLDWVLTPENTQRMRIGVASHNLFLLAYAKYLSRERGVADRVGFEMLRGMTPSHTPALAKEGHGMLLYTPVCRLRDFDVAISYLFRRFEETSASGNFLRALPTLSSPDTDTFQREEMRFRAGHAKQNIVSTGPRRSQERPAPASHLTLRGLSGTGVFVNEPDSDPTLPNVRAWALDTLDENRFIPASEDSWARTVPEMEAVMERARQASDRWSKGTNRADRRIILEKVADVIARRRGDFMNAMVVEGSKTIAEADPEISEAVDFANYYALMAEELPSNFESFGVVTVAAPWNFPSAIGAGGAFAALAAGNSVIMKPSPNTPRCLELIAECAWEAGIPRDVLQFVQAPENDVGRHLITNSDAVILTGSTETADLFKSWNSGLRLFAETSGKNSLVISPAADLDLAVNDLANSAFSNSGQKCSAASIAICMGDVYHSERFRRQLKDAVSSLQVGPTSDPATVMGPMIQPPDEKLLRALTTLEDGEEWLLEPKCLDADGEGRLWTPGVRMNVKPGSWFHRTEVFGPVLGVMHAKDLDEALEMQNGTTFGLTGGIHSLDNDEVESWADRVEVGNGYVNRGITGAIVRRQCFGGWKQSCVGPGAKAGGPNYVSQFGTIRDDEVVRDDTWLALATMSDEREWENLFTKEDDPTNLVCETNDFRYRPLPGIAVRVGPGANSFEAERVRAAIERCGVKVVAWSSVDNESADAFANRVQALGVERVRVVGGTEDAIVDACSDGHVHLANTPVVANGRFELLHYLREQSISRTRHRFGNLVAA